MTDEPMSLEKACRVLAQAHTRDDHVAGFVVEMGAPRLDFFEHSQHDYIEAWRVLRETAHLPTEPA